MKLFGTDGVRGKAGSFLSANLALRLAMSAGIYFRQYSNTNKILVGKDTRVSGYMIENAIVSGLTAVGYDVIQIGPMPTPAIAFLTENMRCDAGIMISASHNTYYDNGIKFFDRFGNKLNESDERHIEDIYHNTELIENSQEIDARIGSSKRIDDVIGRYIVHIKNSFPKTLTLQGVRIVIDTANGAGYKVAPTIFKELGAEVIVINDKPNGTNINDKCGALYPCTLSDTVKEYRADIGFALDGDADRLVVVDERGDIIHGDKLIGALAVYLKNQKQLLNDSVVATVMSNKALEDYLNMNSIKMFRCNVGDKYVLESIQQHSLNFGGEQSGHIIFSDFAKTGDGILSALQVIAYIIKTKEKASRLLNPFKLYPQLQKNLKVEEKIPLDEIKGLKEMLSDIESLEIRHLIRYSGTENKLRILLEGKSEKILEEKMSELTEFLKSSI
jgi:phosphoglucosamine mutase